jgi:hypothetical protein
MDHQTESGCFPHSEPRDCVAGVGIRRMCNKEHHSNMRHYYWPVEMEYRFDPHCTFLSR